MRRDIKKDILDATIKLIEEKGSNLEDITIRDICNRAEVGTGLVNYHFQTKENLINQCVQIIIGDVIGKFDVLYQTLSVMEPIDKLRFLAKSTCGYLSKYENISRISILYDLTNGSQKDNTSQTVNAYLPVIREVCSGYMNEEEIKSRAYLFTLSLQSVFLRSNILKKEIDFDYHNKEQRDELVDKYVDLYFSK